MYSLSILAALLFARCLAIPTPQTDLTVYGRQPDTASRSGVVLPTHTEAESTHVDALGEVYAPTNSSELVAKDLARRDCVTITFRGISPQEYTLCLSIGVKYNAPNDLPINWIGEVKYPKQDITCIAAFQTADGPFWITVGSGHDFGFAPATPMHLVECLENPPPF